MFKSMWFSHSADTGLGACGISRLQASCRDPFRHIRTHCPRCATEDAGPWYGSTTSAGQPNSGSKEGKQAVKMTLLSCHRLRANEVRLWRGRPSDAAGVWSDFAEDLGRCPCRRDRTGDVEVNQLEGRRVRRRGVCNLFGEVVLLWIWGPD